MSFSPSRAFTSRQKSTERISRDLTELTIDVDKHIELKEHPLTVDAATIKKQRADFLNTIPVDTPLSIKANGGNFHGTYSETNTADGMATGYISLNRDEIIKIEKTIDKAHTTLALSQTTDPLFVQETIKFTTRRRVWEWKQSKSPFHREY